MIILFINQANQCDEPRIDCYLLIFMHLLNADANLQNDFA